METNWRNMPELPLFYDRYIQKVADAPLMTAFENNQPSAIMTDLELLKAIGDQVYAPNKWTIKDIIQHIIDTERVLAYRALSIARFDNVALPGFDEETYAKNTQAYLRTLEDLMLEWEAVRNANVQMFSWFTKDSLFKTGSSNGIEISALALGFTIIGHALHHIKVIEDRYLPLIA